MRLQRNQSAGKATEQDQGAMRPRYKSGHELRKHVFPPSAYYLFPSFRGNSRGGHPYSAEKRTTFEQHFNSRCNADKTIHHHWHCYNRIVLVLQNTDLIASFEIAELCYLARTTSEIGSENRTRSCAACAVRASGPVST